nr:hypothetical protein [Angustibacter aerolatus]
MNYLQFLGLAHWSRGDAPAAVAAVERMLPLFDRIEPEMAPRWSIEDRLGAGSLLRVVGERERARTQARDRAGREPPVRLRRPGRRDEPRAWRSSSTRRATRPPPSAICSTPRPWRRPS